MRIILLDVQSRKTAINKTMAGGYGTSSDYGEGKNPFVNILKRLKKDSVKIPLSRHCNLPCNFLQYNSKHQLVNYFAVLKNRY